ncbi:MAG TPA: glycosyltransferase family 9 protein [Geomonas sp.]|nr:glycosyltransferase family 9 protein [Geomonas sp.]
MSTASNQNSLSAEQIARSALLRKSRHILVIQTKFLGDTFWTIPFIENLRRNLPDATISIVVKQGNEAVFSAHPGVATVIGFPYNEIKKGVAGKLRFLSFLRQVRNLHPDCVIDLTDGDRGALMSYFSGARYRFTYPMGKRARHKLFTHVVKPKLECHIVQFYADFLDLLGLVNYTSEIRYHVLPEALASLEGKTPAAFAEGGRPKVVIHPGSRVPLHQWGPHNYARLCDLLSERFDVFLVGGPGEKEILDQVVTQAKRPPVFVSHTLSLAEFAALCSRADLFVGNDSGPIHVAASTGIFVFGLYGPTYDEYSGPITSRKCIIEKRQPPCQPCVRSYCVNDQYRACLELIRPEEVMEKIQQHFPGSGSEGACPPASCSPPAS